MSLNDQTLFSRLPDIDISRSKFHRNSDVKTTFNFGDIIPFYIDEVLPGDTHKIQTSKVVRLQTPAAPIMDNLFLDTYYFYCPSRLLWDKWKEFNGENNSSPWAQNVEYHIPKMNAPEGGWQSGTVADYLGIPPGVEVSVSALPFRMYAKVCDEWFRDENNSTPIQVTTNSANMTGSNSDFTMSDYPVNTEKGAKPFKASKFHDYFTSCLPSPQKGDSVELVGGSALPVVGSGNPLNMYASSSVNHDVNVVAPGVSANSVYSLTFGSSPNPGTLRFATRDELDPSISDVGLVAISGSGANLSVNSLRLAFQTQKMLERDARGGTRYTEMLYSHFGVTSPDASLQRTEYLGGNRIPIQINQMVQSSANGLGSTGAYSLTTDTDFSFEKSFTEHGYIMGVMVARYDHVYQQGIEKFWMRDERTDFYLPVFANIGEQPVYNYQIYADGSSTDNEVFGYQEAWADYRYKPSRNSGEMRTNVSNGFDSWTVADEYTSCPVLSSEWIFEDKTNIDRVLSVTSSVSNQLFADVYIQNECTRPMPLHSIPGGIDHN